MITVNLISILLDISKTFKYSLSHPNDINETKTLPKTQQLSSSSSPSNHHLKVFSSLSSSMTSLNSSSSRSRASSIQETPLSHSSSSASLSSPHSSSKQTMSLSNDEHTLKRQKSFVDRRGIVGGKIKPISTDFQTETKRRHSTIPMINKETLKSYQVNLISPDQIQQTAKLGNIESCINCYIRFCLILR